MLGDTQGAIEPQPATVDRWLTKFEFICRVEGKRATWTKLFRVTGVSSSTMAKSLAKVDGSHRSWRVRLLKVTRCWLGSLAFMMLLLPTMATPEVDLCKWRKEGRERVRHWHDSIDVIRLIDLWRTPGDN